MLAVQMLHSIKSLSLYKGMRYGSDSLAPSALKQSFGITRMLANFLDACSSLESFSVTIETPKENDYQDCKALDFLPDMLYHMENLRQLNLSLLIKAPPDCNPCYDYEQVFPRAGCWPRLFELNIQGFAIGGYDLYSLITRSLPELAMLGLMNVWLLDGSWEGVFEGLRQDAQLTFLHLDILKDRNGHIYNSFDVDKHGRHTTLLSELESYVVFGGRHSCLSLDDPPSKAMQYLQDIKPRESSTELVRASDGISFY